MGPEHTAAASPGAATEPRPGLSPDRPRWLDHRVALLIIFLVALALRLLYLWDVSDQVFFRQLVVDQESYDLWATRIAGGDWIGDQPFYQDPLYPYLLALVYAVFGRNFLVVYVLQALISSAVAPARGNSTTWLKAPCFSHLIPHSSTCHSPSCSWTIPSMA